MARTVLASAILVALSSGTGCSGNVVDIGKNQNAEPAEPAEPAGPVYAVSAPPDQGDDVSPPASRLVDKEWDIVSLAAEGGQVFWIAEYILANVDHRRHSLAMAVHSCSATHCKDSHEALEIHGNDIAWSAADLLDMSLAINRTDVFWSDPTLSNAAGYCPRNDCSTKNELLDPMLDSFSKFAFGVDDTYFYYALERRTSDRDLKLEKCEVADCTNTISRFAMTAPPGEVPYDGTSQIALDGDYLYLLSGTRIIRVRKDGVGSFEVVTRDQQNVGAIAVRGESIFWTESVLFGRILTCPVSGCIGEPRVVASSLKTPHDLALDDEYVYFTYPLDAGLTIGTSSSDRLLRCPIAGCSAPTVLAESLGISGPVVTDDQFVYFTGNTCPRMEPSDSEFSKACSYLAAVRK